MFHPLNDKPEKKTEGGGDNFKGRLDCEVMMQAVVVAQVPGRGECRERCILIARLAADGCWSKDGFIGARGNL